MKASLSLFFLTFISITSLANPGDTTIVQTFTFEEQNNPAQAYDSPGRRFFDFPSDDVSYQKILMYHTLKCFEDGTAGNLGFPCGEWDYLTYTYLYQHTGEYDSNYVWHPHFQIASQNFLTANLSSNPVSDIQQYEQNNTILTLVGDETQFQVGAATVSSNGIFAGALTNRAQFVWTADELIAAGLVAGDMDKIALLTGSGSGLFKHLRIRIKTVTSAIQTNWSETGWTEVYHFDTYLNENTLTEFNFSAPYNWDGASNLLIDFSYTNSEENGGVAIQGESLTGSGLSYSGANRALKLDGTDKLVVPASAFAAVNDQITISFWQFGTPEFQPEDGTVFEGVNSQNQRVLNSHLPWSNGRVYWDAGYDDGYDRIDKAATTAQYEGKWNHWAFTKNTTTGEMKIYLNGVQWHTGSGKDNPIEDIVKFHIGAAAGWTNYYRGAIDEFMVFNQALEAADLTSLMNQGIDNTSPLWTNLLLHYSFDAPEAWINSDLSDNTLNGLLEGNAYHDLVDGSDAYSFASMLNWRPQITFFQGDYTLENEMFVQEESVERPPVTLTEYEIQDYAPVAINTFNYWEGGYTYLYSALGEKLDSTLISTDIFIENDTLFYYSAPFEIVNRYELGRYITPYGIQLDLGTDGWTWVYEVTDFEPLLHGSVELEAGNWQELLDLKFVFIEGPEAREVKRIENVWNGNWNLSGFDSAVSEKTLTMADGEESAKLRTTVTGHGFGFDNNNCGEFCYNTHSLKVNGNTEWSWEIMQDCDKNPLYPQGGTWIFARAGWCPGMEGKTQEFELTPFFQNNEVNVDYDITYDPYGNYVTESQVVYYGEKAFANDAEIMMITAPSDWKIHSRWNPMCDQPKVIIRNKGAQTLTQVTFTYRVEGGATQTYTWNGSLSFMESEEVELTYDDPIIYEGSDEEVLRFYVDINNDENNSNNHAESTFTRPEIFAYPGADDNRMIIILKTNNAYTETSYTLYDREGNVVFSRDNFDTPNFTYRDTIQLNQGCYLFHLKDTEGDGLSFFANDDGNGQCRLDKVNGIDFENFETDFGKEILKYFYFETTLVNVEEQQTLAASFSLYPNPTSGRTRLRTTGFSSTVDVRIYNASGQLVKQSLVERRNANDDIELNVSDLASGMHFVRISDDTHVSSLKMVVN